MADLPDGLKKRLGFDISRGSADFCNHDICTAGLAAGVYEGFYFISHVGDYLDSAAKVLSVSLLFQYIPIYLSAGKVGESREVLVDESFVVAQVQVRLCSVICDEHLSMLQRRHGSRVYIHVWVQLLGRNLESPCLQ